MAQASGDQPTLSTELRPDPDDPRFGWLMLWSLSPTGECCCAQGSSQRMTRGSFAVGSGLDCGNGAGKHPWWVERRGEIFGYRHGSRDADPSQAVAELKWGRCGGARRWGVTLKDTVVIDLDSPESLQAYYRIAKHIPVEKIMGVARTLRGWHVYLDCPGWSQRALNSCMSQWLKDWHGTDKTKITRRGLLMDVRTGENRYVVWPEVDRRWATLGEFRDEVVGLTVGMPRDRMIASGDRAPWNLEMTPALTAKIAKFEEQAGAVTIVRSDDGSISRKHAHSELERWCGYLVAMPPNSGRNNKLNQIAFYAGARAIKSGMDAQSVRDRLVRAASRAGLEANETEATITSGLSAGLKNLTKVS